MFEVRVRISIGRFFCFLLGNHDKPDSPENEKDRVELSAGHTHDKGGVRLAKEFIAYSCNGVGD